MKHTEVFRQAWRTVWRYRALWVFGILVAMTTASASPLLWMGDDDDEGRGSLVYVRPNGSVIDIGGYDGDRKGDGGDLVLNYKHQADSRPYHKGDVIVSYDPPHDLSVGVVAVEKGGRLHLEAVDVRPGTVRAAIAVGIGLACAAALLFVASRIAHYVAETALIQMASEYSETGKRHRMWDGFRIGWSRSAWRLFLIDLAIHVPLAAVLTLLFGVALAPLLLWTVGSTAAGVIGTLFTLALVSLVVLMGVATGAILSLPRRFFRRACALEGLSAGKAIRQGYTVLKDNLLDIGLTWLITVGVRIGLAVLMVPVVLVLVTVSATLGGMLALAVGGLAGLAFEGVTSWILGVVTFIPAFFLVLAAPLAFVDGLREVYLSSTWTLTYRQLRGLKTLPQETQPALGTRSLRTAPAAQ
jgi:hypothetical protein